MSDAASVRVRGVRTVALSAPFTSVRPERWRFGRHFGLTNVLVVVETDEGVSGIGEAPALPSAAIIEEAIRYSSRWLIGREITDVTSEIDRIRHEAGWGHFEYVGNVALAGLDLALWDAVGKVQDARVVDLLGGPRTERCPMAYFLFDGLVSEMEGEAKQAQTQGFQTIFFKGYLTNDRDAEVEKIRALRDALPHARLRMDVNEGWTLGVARAELKRLVDVDLEFVEQPLPMHEIDECAELRQGAQIRLAANQSAWTLPMVRHVIRQRAADVIVTDHAMLGGLGAVCEAAALTTSEGLGFSLHTSGSFGPFHAGLVHVACALGLDTFAHQMYPGHVHRDVVFGRGMGHAEVDLNELTGPGLGLTIDEDEVEAMHEHHRTHGDYFPYGAEL